jgi:GT2 family glycosyltransferase
VSQEPFKVGWVSGACLLIRKQVLDEVDLMDEKLFLFAEDTDLCTRARKKGWDVMLFPGAQIIHYGGQSTEKNLATSITSSHFSRFHFAKKHFGRIAMWILKIICFLELSIKFLVITVKPGMDRKERKSRLKGYLDSFRLIFHKID